MDARVVAQAYAKWCLRRGTIFERALAIAGRRAAHNRAIAARHGSH
jgi:hypothetical protein